jgi:hypothetical protein
VAAARVSALNGDDAVTELDSDGMPRERLLLMLDGVPAVRRCVVVEEEEGAEMLILGVGMVTGMALLSPRGWAAAYEM